jgi:hypothetical protein
MKLTISRLTLIKKLSAEIATREKEAEKFNSGIETRWHAAIAKALVKANKTLASFDAKPPLPQYSERYGGYHASTHRDIDIELPGAERPHKPQVEAMKLALGLLELSVEENLTVDTRKDDLGLGAAIHQLFLG